MRRSTHIVIMIVALLNFFQLLYAQPYREIIDKSKLTSNDEFASFSGDYVIFKENHKIPIQYEAWDGSKIFSNCNFFKLKIFSPLTEEIVSTIDYEKFIEGTDLASLYTGECKQEFAGESYPNFISYGNILVATDYNSLFRRNGNFLKVFNLTTGNTIFTFKLDISEDKPYGTGKILDVAIDDEKIVIYTQNYTNKCYSKAGVQHFINVVYSVSLFYYKTGEFKKDYITFIDKTEADYINEKYSCNGLDYDIVIEHPESKYYTMPKYIINSNKNYIFMNTILIDLQNKTIKKLNEYTINSSTLTTLCSNTPCHITESGDIIYNDSHNIYKYNINSKTESKIYSIPHQEIIYNIAVDNDDIYFILSTLYKYSTISMPYKEWICPITKPQCTYEERIPVIKQCYDKFPLAGNQVTNSISGYNLFKLKNGKAVWITNDYPLYSKDHALYYFVKKGNFLSFFYKIYKYYNYLDPKCMSTSTGEYGEWFSYYSKSCNKEIASCRILKKEDITNKKGVALFIGKANQLSNPPQIIQVYPVIPFNSDAPSTFFQGSNFFRTYRLQYPDGTPIKNAQVLSPTNFTSYTDENGYVNVKNNYNNLAPGTYPNKSIKDIILDINIYGNSYPFTYMPNGKDEFSFIVKDNSYAEKKYAIESGGSYEAGVGAFRAGTVKAAEIDLTSSSATGISFNFIKDRDKRYLEMTRSLTSGAGVKATLAKADIYGVAEGSVESGIMLSGVSTQVFKIDDPFKKENEKERELLTGFIWDTLYRNKKLNNPVAEIILDWIWDNIDFFGLKNSVTVEKAGLQIAGSATAGIDLPFLSVKSNKDVEFKSSNWANVGLDFPSISGEFCVESYVNRNFQSPYPLSFEMSLSAGMRLTKSIFGLNLFSSPPKLPDSKFGTFGVNVYIDKNNTVDKLSLSYAGETKVNSDITRNEFIVDFPVDSLVSATNEFPETIQNLIYQRNLTQLSWDTKNISQLFQDVLKTLSKNISAEITTYNSDIKEKEYKFDLGFGEGLDFGVGAYFKYLIDKRKLEKRYTIDPYAQGLSLIEDFSGVAVEYPQKTLEDLFYLTLEYLKDKVKNLFDTLKKEIAQGSDYIIQKGRAIVHTAKNSFVHSVDFYITVFTPKSSRAATSYRKLAKTATSKPSTTIGDAALINVYHKGTLENNFSIELTLQYSDSDIQNAGLSSNEERHLFMWRYDGEKQAYEFLCNNVSNQSLQCAVSKNGIYGIGYDKTPPTIQFINLASNDTIKENYILMKLSDDFSGIDMESFVIQIDNKKVDYTFEPVSKMVLIKNIEKGEHTITLTLQDSAKNSVQIDKSVTVLDSISHKEIFDMGLDRGWNLKALPYRSSKSIETFDKEFVVSVWKWRDGEWYMWSPKESVMNAATKYNLSTIDTIEYGEGFWIHTDRFANIAIEKDAQEYGWEDIALHKGWNFLGTGKNIETQQFISKGDIKIVWKWSYGRWMAWSPNEQIQSLLQKFNIPTFHNIQKGEGFWILYQ